MRREQLAALVGCVALAGMLASTDADAQGPGVKTGPSASAFASASSRVGPVDASAPLPTGHPHVDDDMDDEADPHVDPHAAGGNPHAAGGGNNGMFQAPEDGAADDPKMPPGIIDAQIADADGKPIPHTSVTLGILYNTVAKGESRKRVTGETDGEGHVIWKDLDTGTGVAYRVMVLADGATFSALPFQLPLKNGMRALLHVYPVERDVEKTVIVTQSMMFAEVKDDRVQIQQAFRIYNVGRSAWVPTDYVIPLPPEFTAFTSQQGMTDAGVDSVPKKGARLRGTFPPGQHMIEFRWQMPYSGEADVRLDVGMMPHCAASRVITPASRAMTLEVEGFPSPQPSTDGQGQRVLVTERQMRRDEAPLKSIQVKIAGLPTEGPGKIFATLLAAGGIALGLVFGTKKPAARDAKSARKRLLAELESLERAHQATEIGPKTYERARRELLDDIARTFAIETPRKKKRAAKSPA